MINKLDAQSKLPTSPDWSTAPEWAMWFAIDDCGIGYWYSNKPTIRPNYPFFWWSDYEQQQCGSGWFDAAYWQNSLQPRPQQ